MSVIASPLISVHDLALRMGRGPAVRLVDASFDLVDPLAGERAWQAGTLPQAASLHLDRDLSSAKTGSNGRHPLPSQEAFARTLALRGIGPDDEVVVFDRQGGMFAGRLWWMLRWIGHPRARVLDGGVAAWVAAGHGLEPGPKPAEAVVNDDLIQSAAARLLRPSLVQTIDRQTLRSQLGSPALRLVDARSPDRFRGENETLDPVAGHIPGARNRFFKDNLGPDGCFKSPEALRQEWTALLGDAGDALPVMQCGSGVTACHNILALAAAGLGNAVLYPGSWSEWCAHADSPVATGAT